MFFNVIYIFTAMNIYGNDREAVGIIDVDSYKASGKMEVGSGVLDLDSYDIQDMNAVDTSLDSKPDIIDVDSYKSIAHVKRKMASDNIDGDCCSNALVFGNGNLANGKVMLVKEDHKLVMQVPKKPNLVTKTQKAPVSPDQWVPDYVKKNHHVTQMEDAVYDAMLMQTNIVNNTNDFYVIQVLEANSSSSYMVYNRWGRVGEQGEIKLSGPHSCFNAIREFEEIFYMKTKNHWSDRINFVSYPKNYTWLEMSYQKKDKGQLSLPCVGKRTFGPRVANFMSLICNFSMMTRQMTDIGYDVEKLPLKNLSKSTILKAYDVLTLIAEILGESNRQLLEELSGEFYSIIPHVFGDKIMRAFIIDTHQKLRSKLEMVESLGEIEHATTLFDISAAQQEDVMFAQYQLLRCTLAPIESTTTVFKMIEQYMKNTASDTTTEIVQIFGVLKEGEIERFKKYAHLKNRMLLWHGTRFTNCLGILSQGLRIAPPQVPLSGASYGRGIYFADMFAKSARYTFKKGSFIPSSTAIHGGSSTASPERTGILLLCEVALGEMVELSSGQRHPQPLPPGKLSVKAVKSTAPMEHQVLEDGVIIPTITQTAKSYAGFNEYIIYNEDQVRMRYIVQVKCR